MEVGGTYRWSVVVHAEFTGDVADSEEIEAELEDWLRQNIAGRWSYGGSSTDAGGGTSDEFFYLERETDARKFADSFGGIVSDTSNLPP
jgi:hypothetical protein